MNGQKKIELPEKKQNLDKKFIERMEYCANLSGNPAKLSKSSGISRSMISDYLSGKSDPSRSRLISIANAAGVSIEWLVTGIGEPQKTYGLSDNPQEAYIHHDSLARIPIMNLSASAGGGSVVTTEDTDGYLAFEPSWLHRMGLNRAELFTMPTMGESMEPTIKAGEYVLCSSAEHHTKIGDGIYVIRLEGNILVKRLQVLPGGILEISSDNAQFYKAFTLDMKSNADFKILGKVIFVHGIRRI